ncbi:MAG: magnesium transporter [Spirochaetaceae bacterium]|jgi:magnesium transporter|nr:magnesium transporter [Spirochaetaceae bacterium]
MDKDILSIIEEEHIQISELYSALADMNVADIAGVFQNISRKKMGQVFRLLPKTVAADVFAYIEPEEQQIIVEALTESEVSDIINKLFVDDAVDVIEEMPADVVNRVLQNVGAEKRKLINQILQYPDDSAGSIMTIEYVELREHHTVAEAFGHIRETGINKETIYTSYVIKKDRFLAGVVSAKDLMLADPEDKIGDIMDGNVVFANTTDDQEATAALFTKYGLLSLPVVDKDKHMVGIITVDDAVEVIEEEATEDFEKMAALNPSDEPYLKTPILKLTRNRILWLLVLMLSATVTGAIIAGFEDALAVLPALVVFIPMLMDTGGNAGSQTSTLIIRGMALGEIQLRDLLRVLGREICIALLCGLGLGIINYARIWIMYGSTGPAYNPHLLSLTVSLSLMITIVIAKGIGCILPMVAKKLNLDPAIMAAPIITTVVDGTSLAVYFAIAKNIFRL